MKLLRQLILLIIFLCLHCGTLYATSFYYFTQKSLHEIRFGAENREVLKLQRVLHDFGYYQAKTDRPNLSGKFDEELRRALEDFQRANGLRVTGKADLTTLQTLNELTKFQAGDTASNKKSVFQRVYRDEAGRLIGVRKEANYDSAKGGGSSSSKTYSGDGAKKGHQRHIMAKILGGLFGNKSSETKKEKNLAQATDARDKQQPEEIDWAREEEKEFRENVFRCMVDEDCLEDLKKKFSGRDKK